MTTLLAIDPGVHTGWALFEDGVLVSCGRGSFPVTLAEYMIIERPQAYPTTHAKQANDLITLAIRIGEYKERVRQGRADVRIEEVLPTVWKGQVPKPIHHRRMREKLCELETELLNLALVRAPKAFELDIQDAVCLGLWKIGRLPKSGR